MSKKIDRTREVKINNFGSRMWIKGYFSNLNITVEFDNGCIVYNKKYHHFNVGKVMSIKCKTVYGVGFLNIEQSTLKRTKSYTTWYSMVERCYSENFYKKYPSYIGCTLYEDWHDYYIFKKWYDENYYEIEGEIICLDKDILVKGNKIYSPNTCVFAPNRVNCLILNVKAKRGKYPIGTYLSKSNKFIARCVDEKGKYISLGSFNTANEAFLSYKAYKENIIKKVSEIYKNKIPNILYQALQNYKIEITD